MYIVKTRVDPHIEWSIDGRVEDRAAAFRVALATSALLEELESACEVVVESEDGERCFWFNYVRPTPEDEVTRVSSEGGA